MRALIISVVLSGSCLLACGSDTSPKAVCAHAASVMPKVELLEQRRMEEHCVEFLTEKQKELSADKWKSFADCALAAEKESDLDGCKEHLE